MTLSPCPTERCSHCGEEELLSALSVLARVWYCKTCKAYRRLEEDIPTPPVSSRRLEGSTTEEEEEGKT